MKVNRKVDAIVNAKREYMAMLFQHSEHNPNRRYPPQQGGDVPYSGKRSAEIGMKREERGRH
jgi:hypothetical protein